MKLSIGIVGLPNVGKSTLFNLLTKQQVLAANYPFATIDPNVGVVPVPDERVDKLTELSKSKKKIPAVVEFYDIAGLVRGANKGEGLGNQFLSHIRDTQAIVMVLRAGQSEEVVHVENTVDALRDMEILHTELALKDLETIGRRLEKAEGEARTGNKDAIALRDRLNLVKAHLGAGKPLTASEELMDIVRTDPEIRGMNLLTAKKALYLVNGTEADISSELVDAVEQVRGDYVVMDLSKDADLAALIVSAYDILDLVSFLTTGEDETRAWTIERGTKAPQAAGVIHTDFERKFIRAEVVSYKDLIEIAAASPSTGSGQSPWAIAKQKGKMRLEGKDYVVQDGDVLVIRHG
jgi:ribosome-binding ATPase YchF (GTP1/OBG family)